MIRKISSMVAMFLLFLIFCAGLGAEEIEIKQEIELCRAQASIEKEKGPILTRIAKLYWKDQEQEKAFQTFLLALEEKSTDKEYTLSSSEKQIYEEALKIYLDHTLGSPLKIANKILSHYSAHTKENPLLGFIVAAAYANQGKFESFFDTFYPAYLICPDHYLAHKAKSILHIKLYERARSAKEREEQRQEIMLHLGRAIQKYPQDESLYKLQIIFASDCNKGKVLEASLNKIIDDNIIIARSDLSFYVAEAVEAKNFPLAQKFIDKARDWYQYSRVVNSAQDYLDKHKNK